jgi:hypothetical protein
MVDSLCECHVGLCVLSGVCLIYKTFLDLAVLPSLGGWLSLY